jgi:hypothetical protein
MSLMPVAESLAADLAGARVDPNEAQKALAYLRTKKDTGQFFDYLRAIVNDGRAVIRSGQTLGYYRDLLAVCERHLRGMPAGEMAQTLGWAIRLLRYYRAVPDAEIVRPAVASRTPERDTQPARLSLGAEPSLPKLDAKPQRAAPPQPAVPQIPVAGATFLGKVMEVDESAVLVEVPGFSGEQAIGVIKSDDLGGKRFAKGNLARVEVIGVRTLKSGRTIVELKPARRTQ